MIKRLIEKIRLYFVNDNVNIHLYMVNDNKIYDIKDLEERCKKVNFAPYDDRLPVHDYEFKWDEYTILLAENWLKQHHPKLAK